MPIKKDYSKFSAGVDILVATPGRLIDHLDNTPGFAQRLATIQVLIFDEADQMLDMGFRPGEKEGSNARTTSACCTQRRAKPPAPRRAPCHCTHPLRSKGALFATPGRPLPMALG